MSYRLDGMNPLAYMGVAPNTPPQMVVLKIQPTVNDYNFNIGTFWVVPEADAPAASNEVYVLMSKAENVATWVQLYPGGGGGGTNTFITDSGDANQVGGDINVLGGSNIGTTGAGSTVTINLDDNVTISGDMTVGTDLAVSGNSVLTGDLTVNGDVDFTTIGSGVVFADGAGELSASNGTNGQVIIGGGANPAWASITSSGSTITVTEGANTLNIDITAPVTVPNGGTGLTSITAHDLIIGNGSSAVTLLAPSATAGIPVVSAGAAADPLYGTAVVAGGGTGNTTFTAYSVICAGTTATGSFQNVSGVGTSGQVLTSNGAAMLPTWQTASFPSYTTGTFTPTLQFGGASVGITYTEREGNYTQIGNVVMIHIQIQLSSKGSSTGTATVSGLPFPPTAALNDQDLIMACIEGITYPAARTETHGALDDTTGEIFLNANGSGVAGANMNDTNLSNNAHFKFQGFYFID